MIGLVIATHAQLAEELAAAAALIIGPSDRVRTVAVRQGGGVEEIWADIAAAIEGVNQDDDGVIIMTDMFGGTPSNISVSFLDPERVEVITGINLPMVLKFFNSPENLTVAELARMLKAYGQQSITLASEFLAS
ncbi:MAG TPA: PTS system fructose subfamily IIA component [Geothermobacteraceae bacterium]|nr:PTS system fructose subfamily IIA component [Geothermobacteraceae bacterium]